ECRILGARPPRLAIPHEHSRNANSSGATYESLARHARAAADESRPTWPSAGVVHPRRARELAAPAATAYRGDREPQVEQAGGARLLGPEPIGNAVRPRC